MIAGVTAIWAANEASWPDASTLVKVAFSDQIAPLAVAIDPGFDLGGGQEHYDGVYYYAIALGGWCFSSGFGVGPFGVGRWSEFGFDDLQGECFEFGE